MKAEFLNPTTILFVAENRSEYILLEGFIKTSHGLHQEVRITGYGGTAQNLYNNMHISIVDLEYWDRSSRLRQLQYWFKQWAFGLIK